MGRSLGDATVALQGFGNVGSHAARLIAEQGARIVAVADHLGAVSNENGLDVAALCDWAATHRTVKGFPGGDPFDGAEVIVWPADVLIPAAMEGAIDVDSARELRAEIVVEAANAPTTPDADAILRERGITVIPDILANAGGVTVSYFEWAQNIQQYRWEIDRVVAGTRKGHGACLHECSRGGQITRRRPPHRELCTGTAACRTSGPCPAYHSRENRF